MVYDRPLVIDSSLCVGWGGLGEVGVEAGEVLDGGFGPVQRSWIKSEHFTNVFD